MCASKPVVHDLIPLQAPGACQVKHTLGRHKHLAPAGTTPTAHELKLGTLEAYSYCVVGKYTAPGGISETFQSTLAVTPCL